MIRTLLRYDPAMASRSLLPLFGFPLSFLLLSWWTSSAVLSTGGLQSPRLISMVALLSTGLLWFTLLSPAGQGWVRVFEYQLALPISARKLVGIRLAAHLLPGVFLFTVLFPCLMLGAPALPIGSPLVLCAALCSAWAAFVLSAFVWQPDKPQIDSSPVLVLLAIGGALALVLPFFAPRLALLLTLPSAVWMALHLWRHVPATMSLESTQARSDSPPSEAQQRAASLDWWIARRTVFQPKFLAISAGLLFFAVSAQWNLSGILFQHVPMTVWFSALLFRISAGALRDFGHLPIPRPRLAAWILLPPAVILVIGTFLGNALGGSWSTWDHQRKVRLSLHQPAEQETASQQDWRLQVPGELLQFHWGNEPLVVEGPGGETATLEPMSLLWGLPLRLVNPYDVELKNSPQFISWQLSRALHQAYGITVAPESLWVRHPEKGPDSPYHFCWDSSAAKLRSYPVGKLAAGLCLSALLWTLTLLLFTLYRRPPRDPQSWKWRIALWVTLGSLFITFAGAALSFALEHVQIHDKFRRTLDGVLEFWITSHPWWSGLLGLAVVVALYRLGVRQIERMETPVPHPVLDT